MMRRSTVFKAGISAMAVYAPSYKVDLEEWCKWTGNSWGKVQEVVGKSFRIPASDENAYTMAANAVVRLIVKNNVNPEEVGVLALGTESSTDNSAGAVIVRGMVDMGLAALGKPRLSRHCEVPEFKHACLGGVYALKNACRYADSDGSKRKAIVVASDIAEYARGSSGEQTQGAGAVAMLVEHKPKMVELDVQHSGSSSAYRGPDFRKPVARHFVAGYGNASSGKINDFPVFSGPYSTVAYLDEVTWAVEDMLSKINTKPGEYYDSVAGLFFHRPYNMMPIQAMSFLYARGLARAHSDAHRAKFHELCAAGKAKPEDVVAELSYHGDLFEIIAKNSNDVPNPYKATNAVAKVLRQDEGFVKLLKDKMSLGSPSMAHFGNLYSAALPCWIATGLDQAARDNIDIAGKNMVMVGYGSGDASEAIPMKIVEGWEKNASKIDIHGALNDAHVLSKEEYDALHSGALKTPPNVERKNHFVIDRIGTRNDPAFQDLAIEYYKYLN